MQPIPQPDSVFLDSLPHRTRGDFTLRNARSGSLLANSVHIAFDFRSRLQGLLGRRSLERGQALVLAPCNTVHTFFMKFSIDVLFMSGSGTVLTVLPGLKPWRFATSKGAAAAIELCAGTIDLSATRVGDRLVCFQNRLGHSIDTANSV